MTPAEMKALRRRLVLTQTALAVQLDLSKRAIAYYEKGERPIPHVVALACWALEYLYLS